MAVIESKVKRSYWKNAALSFIPDLLIAWAVMKYNDGGAEAFFFTLIALQAVYLLLWIKRSVWSWTIFALSSRAFMSSHVEEVLVQQKFPPPPDFISGPDGYYQEIVDNKDEDCEMRIKAAQELGTLAGISVAGQHQLAIQLRMAMEDASSGTPSALLPSGLDRSCARRTRSLFHFPRRNWTASRGSRTTASACSPRLSTPTAGASTSCRTVRLPATPH
jgi:hypothetical protein